MTHLISATIGALWFLGFSLVSTEASNRWKWQYLSNKISVRLVKKSWMPLHPSSEADGYPDEYKGDVPTAFDSLMNSRYEYESAVLEQSETLFQTEGEYDKTKESIIIIHPVWADADVAWVSATVTALALRNLHRKYNVFAVHMPLLNWNFFISIVKTFLLLPTKYDTVAEAITLFMIKGINLNLLKPSQINLIGMSYSGQLVGNIARFINLIYEEKVNTIIALDPYTNSFNRNMVHLSKEDAQVVHVYHTNSAFCGTRERMGTADFTFNNGHIMPECRGWMLVKNGPTPNFCSHRRIAQRWWYIILYPSKFVARKCDSWNRFNLCDCEQNEITEMSYPIRNREVTGTHYLRTIGSRPYGLSRPGAECGNENWVELQNRKVAARLKYGVPVKGKAVEGKATDVKK